MEIQYNDGIAGIGRMLELSRTPLQRLRKIKREIKSCDGESAKSPREGIRERVTNLYGSKKRRAGGIS